MPNVSVAVARGRSLALGLLAAHTLLACGGSGSAAVAPPGGELQALDAARLDATWPVQFATEESVGGYGGAPGWVALVMHRDLKAAVEKLGPKGGAPAARAHGDAAAMYRQAALLEANALIQTYGATPEATDPVGAAHLLAVSYALTGDLTRAREASARLDGVEDPTTAWHAPWKAWLAAGATWPPDLTGLPIELPEPAPGGWPEVDQLPHYQLPEVGAAGVRPMGDPGALVALALWHDRAAHAAAPELDGALAAMRAGYHLPAEPDPAVGGDLPMDLLFGSDLVVSADARFLAAVHGEQGAAAVDAYASESVLAWLAAQSRVDGKIDAERAVDVLAGFRQDLVDAAAAKTGGETKSHQRQFADIAYVGAFRSLALVAEVEGDREASGLLRINALDRSQKATACPVGLIALGAWDASNRYPTRAQDILHAQARRFPSLDTARYGLDVMALRVSRERPGETPGM